MNTFVFVLAPALIAVLFGLLLFHRQPGRIPFSVGESVLRALCVLVLTWISFSALTSLTWCQPRDFFPCLSTTLKISGILGGGTILPLALVAAVIVGVLAGHR